MRFAGSAPITDFLSRGIDTGALAQAGQGQRSNLKNVGTQLQGELGATALGSIGKVKSMGLIAEGQAAQAAGQAQGSMFSSLGSSLGGAIGGFGGFGGGGGSYLGGGGAPGGWSIPTASVPKTSGMNFFRY